MLLFFPERRQMAKRRKQHGGIFFLISVFNIYIRLTCTVFLLIQTSSALNPESLEPKAGNDEIIEFYARIGTSYVEDFLGIKGRVANIIYVIRMSPL